ncbi:30586_t:CDS:1, partial [Racocetra persica]
LTLAWFVPLLEKQFNLLFNFDSFIIEFETIFSNSDKVRTAANKIQKLTQEFKPALNDFLSQ